MRWPLSPGRILTALSRAAARRRPSPCHRARPSVEQLEDRNAPGSLTAISTPPLTL